ncbi:hypothetical protein YC2023_119137 [Brassica napus]
MVVEYQEEREYPPPNTFPSASCSDMTNGGSPCRTMELVKVFCFSLISSSSCCCCCTLVIESRAVADGWDTSVSTDVPCLKHLTFSKMIDCLIINCKVGVVVSEVQCPPTFTFYSRVPVSELGSHFGVLLDSMEGSDVTFNIAGDKFQSHKLVLAARSPFFKSKFSNELEANSTEVTINDLEPKTFDLLKLPDIYETLIVKLLAAADKYKATELKSVCLKFTAENLAAVLETDGYQQQKDECLSLQSELLKAVAGYEESSNSIAKSLSVWAQLSEGGGCGGGDTSSRHVRQRTT